MEVNETLSIRWEDPQPRALGWRFDETRPRILRLKGLYSLLS